MWPSTANPAFRGVMPLTERRTAFVSDVLYAKSLLLKSSNWKNRMLQSSWLNSLCQRLTARKPGRLTRRRRVSTTAADVRIECLEPRVLLSASPVVTSIERAGTADTNATSVDYTVTFSEAVQGVDAPDFTVLTAGGVVANAQVTVTPVDGSVYTVTVAGVAGNGIVGLDLVDDNSIHDADGNALIGEGLATQISQNLPAGEWISNWQLSADQNTIVYAISEGNYTTSLWSRPVSGGTATQLSTPLDPNESINSWQFTTDGTSVFYTVSDIQTGGTTSLWTTPLSGGASTELNTPLSSNQSINQWQLISGDTEVLYAVYDSNLGGITSLWDAPLDGSPATQLTTPLGASDRIVDWRVSSDGTTVVYELNNLNGYGGGALWTTSVSGGTASQLSATLNSGEGIYSWQFTPDTTHVIYSIHSYNNGYYGYYSWYYGGATSIWSAPATGGTAVQLTTTLSSGQGIYNWQVSGDSTYLVYDVRPYDGYYSSGNISSFWATPVSGGASTQVSPPLGSNESIGTWDLSPDGISFFFGIINNSTGRYTSFTLVSTNGVSTTLAPTPTATEGFNDWGFSPDSKTFYAVVYDYSLGRELSVWLASTTGVSTQIAPTLTASQGFNNWGFTSDGKSFYATVYDYSAYCNTSLWIANPATGVSSSLAGTLTATQWIYDWGYSPDGTSVYATVDDSSVGQTTLIYLANASTCVSTQVGPLLGLDQGFYSWSYSPDSAAFTFTVHDSGTDRTTSVWLASTSGGLATQLNPTLGPNESILLQGYSPDGSQFWFAVYDYSRGGFTTFWIVPTAGDVAAPLNIPLSATEAISNWQFSADGKNLFYSVYDSAIGGIISVWVAPTNGDPAMQLSTPLGASDRIIDWRLSPDGATVIYELNNLDGYGGSSLWTTPVAGGAATQFAILLNPGEGIYDWQFTSDGSRLVADIRNYTNGLSSASDSWYNGGAVALWSAPTAAGAAALLTTPLATGQGIYQWLVSPDGTHITYDIRPYDGYWSVGSTMSVWGTALAGGVTSQFSPPLGPNDSIRGWGYTPDSAGVYISVYDSGLGQQSLWMAPISGAGPTNLTPSLAATETLDGWNFSPDGSSIAFTIANTHSRRMTGLWAAPTNGGPAVLVSDVSKGAYLIWNWQTGHAGLGDSFLIYELHSNHSAETLKLGSYSRENGAVTGPTYLVDQIVPTVTISPGSSSPISGTTATFTVTFSEDVQGVTADDFALALGGVTVADPIVVTPVNGHVYTISLSGISGNGTIGVNLANTDQSVMDAASNVVAATTGGLLTVNQPGGPLQLSGTTLTINGTGLDDTITISEAGMLTVVFDGVTYLYTPAQVTAIVVNGNDGVDMIQVNSLLAGTTLTADGGNGNDTLKVAAAVTQAVHLSGGSGNDLLVGGSGDDTLDGGIGNDWLSGGDGSDLLIGGVGNDVYAFGNAVGNQIDTVLELTNEGTDLLNFSAMTTAVTVNLTSDTALATMAHRIVVADDVNESANFENVNGGSANDVITGNASNNVVYGNGGDDTLKGLGGNDEIHGGDGNDTLLGGVGSDVLDGGIGNDWLNGGDGYNTLVGGQGNDVYAFDNVTTNQVDTVVEQADQGTDTLNFSSMTDNVTANLTSDSALATMAHRIVQTGGAGQAANFENVSGGSGTDTLIGNAANNVLTGNGGTDVLSGGDGNDELSGGDGRNILIGGNGADYLVGGSDQDLLLSDKYHSESTALALQSMLVEWVQATPYQTRIDHLLGTTPGGANGSYVLSSATVTVDASADYLTGGGGQDWFLANSALDVLNDKAVDEVFTHIDSWI